MSEATSGIGFQASWSFPDFASLIRATNNEKKKKDAERREDAVP